jgi:hypothetical protein
MRGARSEPARSPARRKTGGNSHGKLVCCLLVTYFEYEPRREASRN